MNDTIHENNTAENGNPVLSHASKIGYGVSELGTMATEMLIRLYLLIFYTDYIGLKPALAGYAVAIAVVWDAVTDPVMGMISDITHTRWGKRRPYILIGAVLLSFAVILLFSNPGEPGQTGKFLYLLVTYILVNTCMTVVSVPHFALARDLTFNPHERVEVFGWRLFFGNVGFFAGTILPGIFLLTVYADRSIENSILAHHRAAQVLAIIIVCASATTFFATRRIDKRSGSYSLSGPGDLFRFLKEAFRNRAFLPLFIAYCFAMIGISLNSSFSLYYYRYRLLLPENSVQSILALFVIVFSLSIAFWVFIARHYGKKKPAIIASALLGVIITICHPFLPQGMTMPAMLTAMVAGSLVGSITLIETLVADSVDLDELKSGINREGLYFGIWKMGIKLSRAVALIVTGHLLSLIGYIPNQTQTADVTWKLALIYGPGVGFFIIAGSVILIFMPLTNETHRRIQRLLIKKRQRREHKNV